MDGSEMMVTVNIPTQLLRSADADQNLHQTLAIGETFYNYIQEKQKDQPDTVAIARSDKLCFMLLVDIAQFFDIDNFPGQTFTQITFTTSQEQLGTALRQTPANSREEYYVGLLSIGLWYTQSLEAGYQCGTYSTSKRLLSIMKIDE